jgi:predicted glycogen debranching enzyme
VESDYGSVDATLWFFYALDAYLRATGNDAFLEDFFPHLVEAIDKYIQGTSLGIGVDPTDGLLVASQPGKALTWMNASVDGVAVTPRSGKAVEVNALWYHALSLLLEWSQRPSHAISRVPSHYQQLLTQCRHSFQQRFWYSKGGYLYDVIDGPQGNDAALRPNQLLALSLRYSVLDTEYRQSIFDAISQHLLTPFGLRTLAPGDAAYCGRVGQSYADQQRALHQGSAWSWLLGPYIDVMLAMRDYSEKKTSLHEEYPVHEYLWRKSLLLLEPFEDRFSQGLLGMCEGVFAGDAPYTAGKGCASLLSTSELLRIYDTLTHIRVLYDDRILSH